MSVLMHIPPNAKLLWAPAGVLLLALAAIFITQQGPVTWQTEPAVAVRIPQWEQIYPAQHPGLFKGGPGTMAGDTIVMDKIDGFTYRANEDGLVMGQTRFGYAYFASLDSFEAFNQKHQ